MISLKYLKRARYWKAQIQIMRENRDFWQARYVRQKTLLWITHLRMLKFLSKLNWYRKRVKGTQYAADQKRGKTKRSQ